MGGRRVERILEIYIPDDLRPVYVLLYIQHLDIYAGLMRTGVMNRITSGMPGPISDQNTGIIFGTSGACLF